MLGEVHDKGAEALAVTPDAQNVEMATSRTLRRKRTCLSEMCGTCMLVASAADACTLARQGLATQ